jgi:Ca2+-binding RTX toxin-like protein
MNIKYTCFLVLFLFCITADQASARVIHTAKFNGHIYYLLDTDGTKWWLAAEQEAVSLGGHLVTINNAAENKWVYDTFIPAAVKYAEDNNLPDQSNISLWSGLSDYRTEGNWVWSSGESVSYSNWYPGEPAGGVPDEDFGGIFGPWATPGQWHDIVGDTRVSDLPFGVVEIISTCNGLKPTIIGTFNPNLLIGTPKRDIINGLGGDDVIYGLGEDDIICGGGGNDVLLGGNGNDQLFGESGRDSLIGEAGNDRLSGQDGNDYLSGGDGNDAMNGGLGVGDVCDGGALNGDRASCEFKLNVP